MNIKIMFVYEGEVEYDQVLLRHPLATPSMVMELLQIKYRMFGLKVAPTCIRVVNRRVKEDENRVETIKLRIPSPRALVKVNKSMWPKVAEDLRVLAVKLSREAKRCPDCETDHDLMDFFMDFCNPKVKDPWNKLVAKLPELRPGLGVPKFRTSTMQLEMVLN